MDTSSAASSSPAAAPPPNHHGGHAGFSGASAYLYAAMFALKGGPAAQLAVRLSGVGPGDHVVDIGCGPGTAVRAALGAGATGVGVDPSRELLRVAGWLTRRRGAQWLEGAAESLPVPDGSATVVWSLACVHHWHDLDQGLAEVHRVLRPGGRFVAIERQVAAGADGLASHGWTRDQAERFAEMCEAAGLVDAQVELCPGGKEQRLAVLAQRAMRS